MQVEKTPNGSIIVSYEIVPSILFELLNEKCKGRLMKVIVSEFERVGIRCSIDMVSGLIKYEMDEIAIPMRVLSKETECK